MRKLKRQQQGAGQQGGHTHTLKGIALVDTLCYVPKDILAGAYVTTAKKAEKVIEVNRKSDINRQVEDD